MCTATRNAYCSYLLLPLTCPNTHSLFLSHAPSPPLPRTDESDEESVAGDSGHAALLPSLKSKLKEVQSSHESLLKNSNALLRSLADLESGHHRAVTHAKEKLTAAKLTASSFTKVREWHMW